MKATRQKYYSYIEQLKKCPYEIGFMKVSDININSFLEEDSATGNEYIKFTGWENFKTSIEKHGTYWAFHVSEYDYSPSHNIYRQEKGCWFINEGFHRFKAILELIEEKRLPKNYKVLVIRKDSHPLWYEGNDYFKRLEKKVRSCYGYIHPNSISPAREINEEGYCWKTL